MDSLQHCDKTHCATSSPCTRPDSDGYHAARFPSDIIHEILPQVEMERDRSPTPYRHTWTVLQPTLFALCLLDRECNAEATRRLYKDVFIPSWRALSLFIRTLSERPEFRNHVQSFCFLRIRMEDSEQGQYIDHERDIGLVYTLCPNISSDRRILLKKIRLDRSSTLDHIRMELHRLSFLIGAKKTKTRPLLEELVLDSEVGNSSAFYWTDMPQLKRLCLHYCTFLPQRRMFPPGCSKGLRALEIVGGTYMAETFWTEVDTFRASLEHLSLLSESFTMDSLTQGRLHKFPSLTSLRILATSSMGHERTSIPLPPQVINLVIVAGQYDDPQTTWNVEEAVMEQVKVRRQEHGRSRCRWESVLFAGVPDRHTRIDQKIIQTMAGQVGVRFDQIFRDGLPYGESYIGLFRY